MSREPNRLTVLFSLLTIAGALIAVQPASAADWSNTELHIQYGTLDVPGFAGGGDKDTLIFTLQHASGWKYGDNFFFFDVISSEGGGFNDTDTYGEWYPNFSISKLQKKERISAGAIKDVGIIAGFNWDPDADVIKYLPGIRLAWDVPGAIFFNTDITAYIDDSRGVAKGGAPKEDDTFMIDLNWGYPFGGGKFSIEGHVEYIGERTNEFGGKVSEWILGQPQLRYYPVENLAIGIEYQFWYNKLGDPGTDEQAVQALLVWKF